MSIRSEAIWPRIALREFGTVSSIGFLEQE